MTGSRPIAALLVWSAAGLAGCSPPPPPATLDLAVTGSADQNPSSSGVPMPVAVHLYQLTSAAKFERADVFALIEREQATLGPDMLASEEFVLAPSEKRAVRKELKKGAQFLGVLVLFQDIDHAKWRASSPVADSGPTRLTLAVDKLSADLAPAK